MPSPGFLFTGERSVHKLHECTRIKRFGSRSGRRTASQPGRSHLKSRSGRHSGTACASTLAPGIQADRVMPSQGDDPGAACIVPALPLTEAWLFPHGLDSVTAFRNDGKRSGARRSGMTYVWGRVDERPGFRDPSKYMPLTWFAVWIPGPPPRNDNAGLVGLEF